MRLYISNGLIVDPINSLEVIGDLWVEDGIIEEIRTSENNIDSSIKDLDIRKFQGNTIHIDAKGKWVVPGLIDLHVHFREPGFEHKEDIASGCRAAAKGGFTTVCCMPNTKPVIDCGEIVSFINNQSKRANGVNVLEIGSITKGQEGKELADYNGMIDATSRTKELTGMGICGMSEDGKTVKNSDLMMVAMEKLKKLGLPVFSHAQPEEIIVERDINLSKSTRCKLHFCHISTRGSVNLIRNAKKQGIDVTAETAPHYFALDKSHVKGDTNKKMNPPLRTREDRKAVLEALEDGTIDIIATDHAPHHEKEKKLPFEEAAFGVSGLETAFPVSYTRLVKTGILTPIELISKMSTKPAEIIGIDRGSLSLGKVADITIIDIKKEYEIDPDAFLSKGKNSPFKGMRVFGSVDCTIVGGSVVWERKKDDR